MPFYRGELDSFHPSFPEGSAVAPSKNASPVAIEAPKLQYSKEDDAAIDEYHRKTGEKITVYLMTLLISGM
jgi:alcohol oxidase